MLFRMKRNAAGLASICILFTMLLVTVSTTLCLYLGRESSLQQLYPTAVTAFGEASSSDDVTEALNTAESIAQKNGVEHPLARVPQRNARVHGTGRDAGSHSGQ